MLLSQPFATANREAQRRFLPGCLQLKSPVWCAGRRMPSSSFRPSASAKHSTCFPEHPTLLMSLQMMLRMRRTMTGTELDRAIATVLAHEASVLERRRRRDWQNRLQNAAKFKKTMRSPAVADLG
jgi:hypothetical protein